jgi:RHS repeat-associated protein
MNPSHKNTGFQNSILKIINILMLFMLPVTADCRIDEFINRLKGNAIVLNDSFSVVDDQWPAFTDVENQFQVRNYIMLEVNEEDNIYRNASFTDSVVLEVRTYDAASNYTATMVTLRVSFNPAANTIHNRRNIYFFEGAHKITVVVKNNPAQKVHLIISAFISANRIFNFDSVNVHNPQTSSLIGHSYNRDRLNVQWASLQGADEYDLEYSFYYLNSGELNFSTTYNSLDWLFENNASRLTTPNLFVDIPMTYPAGYLFYRLRGVRYRSDGIRHVTPWTTTTVSSLSLTAFACKQAISGSGFMDSLNWQLKKVFAEEGKSINSLNYFDGSLRERQNVSELRTENKTLVKSTFYDHLGREILKTVPWVDTGSSAGYKKYGLLDSANTHLSVGAVDYSACNLKSLKLSNTNGPGGYYSPNNLMLADSNYRKYNKYIPDAEQYPYAMTQYGKDSRNRIVKQSGPGAVLRLGANHETNYLYGKPSQLELDRMFGNDAGYDSLYLKNMVVDPNGQASISYLNSSGQVVATALAGLKPANLNAIDDTIATINLTDSLNLGKLIDGKLVNTYALLMPIAGNVTIGFNLNPQAYSNSCKPDICYDCLYTIKITINGACGSSGDQTYTLRNYTLGTWVDSSCATANGTVTDSRGFTLGIGEYIITKEISLVEDTIQVYAQRFVEGNSCIPDVTEIRDQLIAQYDNQCEVDCEGCLSALGTKSDFLEDYINRIIDLGLVQKKQDTIDANKLYDQELAECKEICETQSECASFKKTLLADMSPGGQYFTYEFDENSESYIISDPTSIFYGANPIYKELIYYDENGNKDSFYLNETEKRFPHELSIGEFIDNWKDSWAQSLLPFHPEYCYLEWCDSLAHYFEFDSLLMATNDYETALSNDLLHPFEHDSFFLSGGPGFEFRDSMLGIFNDPFYLGSCGSATASQALKEFVFGNGYYGCNDDTTGCATDYDFFWLVLKTYYLGLKRSIVCELINEYAEGCSFINPKCIGNSPPGVDCSPGNYINKEKRWICPEVIPAGDYFDYFTQQLEQMKEELKDSSYTYCESFGESWLYNLKDCPCLQSDPDKQEELKLRFIEICKNASDANHLIGATTCVIPTVYGDTSFQQALEAVCEFTVTACDTACNINYVQFPGSYHRQAYFGMKTISDFRFDTCICNRLDELQECYDNKPVSDTTTSFYSFLLQIGNYNLSSADLDSLNAICSSRCKYLSEAVQIPPYLECDVCRKGSEVAIAHTRFVDTLCTGGNYRRKTYEAYMNVTLGLNLDSIDYANFLEKFEDYNTEACADAFVLCPKDMNSEFPEDTSCYGKFLDFIDMQVLLVIESKRDSLRNAFVKAYKDHCFGQRDQCGIQRPFKEYHQTLYYYDQSGILVKTVPPEGFVPITNADTLAMVKKYRAGTGGSYYVSPKHKMASRYWLNSLNEVVRQVSPDGGVDKIWYDMVGRPVVSQKAWQNKDSLYSYTRYDAQGRVYETGQLKLTNSSYWPVDSLLFTTILFDTLYNRAVSRTYVTRTFYDTAYYSVSSLFGADGQENLRKKISAIAYFNKYTGNDLAYDYTLHYSYDILGNVKTFITDMPGMSEANRQRYKKIEYSFDLLSGKVNSLSYQRDSTDQFYHRYQYDQDNRLITTETSHDSLIWDRDVLYAYLPHGPLGRKELGALRVQGIDYAYSIHGWLKAINGAYIDSTKEMGLDGLSTDSYNKYVGVDAINLSLYYFSGDYKKIKGKFPTELTLSAIMSGQALEQFNGNIRASAYGIRNLLHKGYMYQYDQLNRIISSRSQNGYNTTTMTWLNIAINNSIRTDYTYSPNGNFKTLKRYNSTSTFIDNLTYTYKSNPNTQYYPSESNNELDRIADAGVGCACGDLRNQSANNYRYDLSGQLRKDVYETLDTILWTAQGKIDSITKSNGMRIKYEYDGLGHRVMKKIKWSSGTHDTLTYYIYDPQGVMLATYNKVVQTSGGSYKHIKLQEQEIYGSDRLGYVIMDSVMYKSTGTPAIDSIRTLEHGKTRYELTDHLGNVLSVIADKKISFGSTPGNPASYFKPDVISAQDYFPFGMVVHDRTYNTGKYRFGFNGKEYDTEVKGPNIQQDYGMRFYDPRVARFLSVDPITKQYPELTPYQFASNTPIQAVDLDGLEMYYAADGSYIGKSGKSTEIRIISNDDVVKVAKQNLKHRNYDHKWLLERSVTAYENTYQNQRKILTDWAEKNQNASVENTMSVFTKTLKNKTGKEFEVLIPGSTGTNNIKNEVDPLKSNLIIDNVNLTNKSGFKRDLSIHNHPNGNTKFSDQYGPFGGREGDIPAGIELGIKIAITPRGDPWIKLFDPKVYNKNNPAGMGASDIEHRKAAKSATNPYYIFLDNPKP